MNNKVKRIIFIGGYTPGDASSNFIVSFCKGYAEMGMDVKLLLQLDSLANLPVIQGVDIHPILRNTKRIGPINLSRFLREKYIINILKEYYIPNETVVQYYGSPTYGWMFDLSKYDIIHTIGEVPFANPYMSFSYKVKEWMRRLSTKKATGLLVQTNFLKEYFINYGIKRVCVFNILIDPNRFEGLKKSSDSNYISYCGRVGVYKDGVNDLIDAFAIVHTSHPQIKLRIIGGFSSKEDEQILKNKVKDLNLKGCVVFTGKVTPKEMPALLFDSTILALARPDNKQAKYGFPSKLGEYLFTGNPTVLTRVGEIGNFLTDKQTCVFANPDDPKDFAEKLNWVLDNPEKGQRIGVEGKKVAMNNFSVLSQCKVALNFFNTIINE